MAPPSASTRTRLIVAGASALALVIAGFLIFAGRGGDSELAPETEQTGGEPNPDVENGESADPTEQLVELSVELFFPASGNVLYPESRSLSLPERLDARVEGIVQAILAGPESANLAAPFPGSVAVAGVYSLTANKVVVDLGSTESRPPSTGSRREILTVYSLVNSILLNIDSLDSVVLMWNGVQPTTFSGHLDTTGPLYARPEMVVRRDPPKVAVAGNN